MKKYKIKFTTDYYRYNELSKNGNYRSMYKKIVEKNPGAVEFCRKWHGKEITILELEKLIDKFGSVVFDGETIEIYNDYRE